MRCVTISVRQLVILVALVAMAFAGIGLYSTQESNSAVAQSEQMTWHTIYLGDWPAEDQVFDGKAYRGTAFVDQLPAECDLLISPHDDLVFYYSCPMPWEPKIDG